jgi:mRNA interferase ChpB
LSGAGTGTQGVVLCSQPRVLDLQARKARCIETLPDFIMDEVLAKLLPLVE